MIMLDMLILMRVGKFMQLWQTCQPVNGHGQPVYLIMAIVNLWLAMVNLWTFVWPCQPVNLCLAMVNLCLAMVKLSTSV